MAAYGDWNTLCPTQTFTQAGLLANFPNSTDAPWTVLDVSWHATSISEGWMMPTGNSGVRLANRRLHVLTLLLFWSPFPSVHNYLAPVSSSLRTIGQLHSLRSFARPSSKRTDMGTYSARIRRMDSLHSRDEQSDLDFQRRLQH